MLTLAEIEETLFQGLARINPSAASPAGNVPAGTARTINGARVAYIGRWLGEPVRGAAIPDALRAAIVKEVGNRTPSILLAFESETVDPGPNAVETMSGNAETVMRATWSVLCVVRDGRATKVLMQGTGPGDAATLGVLDVEQLVEEALTNLSIDGLYRSTNVRFLGSQPYMATPGEGMILRMQFATRRVAADARALELDPNVDLDGTAYTELAGDANLYPAGLAGDNLGEALASFTATTDVDQERGDLSTPIPTRGLVARFRADAIMGVDAAGDPRPGPNDEQRIPVWTDRANRWVLAEADTAGQPAYSAPVGDPPVVLFAEGTRLGGYIDWLPVRGAPRTLVAVVESPTPTATDFQYVLSYGSEDGDVDGGEFALVLVNGGAALYAGLSVNGTTPLITLGDDIAGESAVLVIASYEGTTARLRCVAAASTVDTEAATLATRNARRFELGRSGTLAAGVAEVFVYRAALSVVEEDALAAYVLAHYGGP